MAEQVNKVYVLSLGRYDDERLEGIFSTAEKAIEVGQNQRDYFEVCEHLIDDPSASGECIFRLDPSAMDWIGKARAL